MLGYYRQTFRKLAVLVNSLDPWSDTDAQVCLEIQKTLVPSIRRVESQIRRWKAICPQTERTRETIASYQRAGRTLRHFGDAIAFTYMDRWDIKPLSRGNSSGFISDKKGFRLEHCILEAVAQNGERILLADLTNCLRHGDAYCFAPDKFPLVMEIKDTKRRKLDTRSRRQKKRLESVFQYLHTDQTIVRGQAWNRVSLSREIVDHGRTISEVAEEAFRKGQSVRRISSSLAYIATTRTDVREFETLVGEMSKPIVSVLASERYYDVDGYPYYPIALTIRDPDALADYLAAKMILAVAVDFGHIEERVTAEGASITLLDQDEDDPWVFDMTHSNGMQSKVSSPMFGRLFHEFWDLDYFIDSFLLDTDKIMEFIDQQMSDSS